MWVKNVTEDFYRVLSVEFLDEVVGWFGGCKSETSSSLFIVLY
jgi:hypothetical protein